MVKLKTRAGKCVKRKMKRHYRKCHLGALDILEQQTWSQKDADHQHALCPATCDGYATDWHAMQPNLW
ncbi:hypothetical protein CSB45_11055 [candidate division KSB3 bacterium]|uniref:Uncharacterized protein n=1 Tax=candidate division KSB3 bacterium TaxID=2044937 RepID=A0A2G6E3B8_9BACT|nr:MAG: hypothetical protein CSB45_11055 [candidate division KSB3 bacterium]PIE29052.1 MAG: hypothetical protein CSA57_10550 [candidate division KSB3 bacterium]